MTVRAQDLPTHRDFGRIEVAIRNRDKDDTHR
jgi:hypothetical protein